MPAFPSLKASTLVLALLGAGIAGAEGVPLEGHWEAEGVGRLEVTRKGPHYEGHLIQETSCAAPGDRPTLEGTLEGSVLVGSLWVCQKGPSCESKGFPILGFFDSAAGRLTSLVRLDSGCTSEGLQGSVVSLIRVGDLPRDLRQVSAANIAERGEMTPEEKARRLNELLTRGHSLLQTGRASESIEVFREILSIESNHWLAHLGMGLGHMSTDRLRDAQREMELALRHAPKDKWDAHFNLGCLHARRGDRNRALRYLEGAVERGFDLPESMARDPDLAGLLRNDIAFQRLVNKAGQNKMRTQKRR